MPLGLSQPTLGLLRKSLRAIESNANLVTPYDRRTFWRDELFDFGFAIAVIDLFATYRFDWGAIIPDLYLGRLESQNVSLNTPLSPLLCEQTLHRLLAFALNRKHDSEVDRRLREALKHDGLASRPTEQEILHALERGEKFEAETMEELREAGLITMTDAGHFDSRADRNTFLPDSRARAFK